MFLLSKFSEWYFQHNKYTNDYDDLCIKFFFLNFISPKKNYQKVEKIQLLIVLPFLGRLSFKTRNRLNKCIRNQLTFCLLTVAFQLKTRLSSLFKVKDSFPKYLLILSIIFLCSCNTIYYGETYKHLFVYASEHLRIIPLTEKMFKNAKNSYYGRYFIR